MCPVHRTPSTPARPTDYLSRDKRDIARFSPGGARRSPRSACGGLVILAGAPYGRHRRLLLQRGTPMGADQQIAFFVRELSAPDPARRAAAAKGLGRIGQAAHAPVLAAAARGPEPVVRAAAALGLGRLGRPGGEL